MRNLRRLAGIIGLFVLIFMIIALFQEQTQEKESFSPDQIEIFLGEDWIVTTLNSKQEDLNKLQKQVKAAQIKGEYQIVDLPYIERDTSFDWIVFQNILPKGSEGLTVHIPSTNTDIYVLLDGEILYQYKMEEELEYQEHLITLPYVFQSGELWIALYLSNPDTEITLDPIRIETHVQLIGLLGNDIVDIGCCLFIMIMAMILFVLVLIRRYTNLPLRGEFFLGLAGLITSIYCFIETNTLNLFYGIQDVYKIQEYFLLLLPLFFALYFERNLYKIYPHRFSILLGLVSIQIIIQLLLQVLGIQNLEEMTKVSAIVLGMVCLTGMGSLIQLDYKNKCYRAWLPVLSLIALLGEGIANIVVGNFSSNFIGQYSMTFFYLVMTSVHILQFSREYRTNTEEKVNIAKQQNIQLMQAKKEADTARHEAIAANEAKGKFLARMSHEIRTPINAVLGMDEMILRESKEPSIKEYAMDIYTAGQTLLSLINDILDFSKIDSGKMEIVPVEYDISSLIHDLSNMTLQRANSKNIRFEVEVDSGIPSRLYGDDVRIRQVLTNILTNAVKYTHEGTVWLRVQSHRSEKGVLLQFEVEDTGIGIKEEDLPKLSTEFERIEEEKNRNIEGTGLGMNITIQLLALLGSKLQVESIYGKGSKFYFELEQTIIDATPIGEFEARVRQIMADYHYSTKCYAPDAHILVVDDNAVNRKVFRSLLKETQIQVTEAEGGAECFELV